MKRLLFLVVKAFQAFDWPLLVILMLMAVLGMTVMHSAVGDTDWRFADQLRNFGLAFFAMWIVALIPPPKLMRLAPLVYAVGVALLLGVEFFGETSKGATRWLNLGIGRIQPSEMLKIGVPLMLACVLAHFVSRAIAEVAMYDVTLARERDIVLRRQLRHTKLAELVRPAQTVIATTAPVQEALQMFAEYPVKYLYVVNERNIYQGVIAQQDLTSLLLVHGAVQDKRAGDVLRLDFVKTVYADMGLDEAQDQFVKFQGERLPVVSRGDEPVVLGVVYKSSLLEQYSALKRSLDQSGEGLLDASSRRT